MLQFHFQKHALNHFNIHLPNILTMATDSNSDLHLSLLRDALSHARLSPPKPTNFRIGALLYSPSSNPQILTTGYTLESPGNTHAEQTCFLKLAAIHSILPSPISSGESDGSVEDRLGPFLPEDTVLYTTMEPCNKRSAGNLTCVERILRLRGWDGGVAIRRVVCGVREPEKFVGENKGRKRLEEAGIEVVHVGGLEEEILEVATAGHVKE
jgi:pyrimidine deaminase RibD-like protein